MALTNTGTILKPLISALANQPTALGELSSAGITIMVGTAVLCSLYGLYWDGDKNMVFANYVPGEAYAWMVGWMGMMLVLLIVFLARQQIRYLLLLLLAAIYWVFWLSIPLIGYSWFYAWRFVDVTAAQAAETEAHPVPFSRQTAQSLGAPFALCVYFGALCAVGGFMLSSAQYARHLHLLNTNVEYRQQVFIEARRAQAAQARAGNAVARLLRLLPRSSRSRAQGDREGADGSEHGESESEHEDDESDEESGRRRRNDGNHDSHGDGHTHESGSASARNEALLSRGDASGRSTTDGAASLPGGGLAAEAGTGEGPDATTSGFAQSGVAADVLARVGSGIVLSARGANGGSQGRSRQPTAML